MLTNLDLVVHCLRYNFINVLNLQDQLADFSQILLVASSGSGKGCTRFWGRSDQNCGYHGNRNLPLTYNGKTRCLRVFSVTFNKIFVKLAGNEDRHKISDEVKCWPGRTFHFGVFRRLAFPLTLNGEIGVSIISQIL